MSTAEQNAQDLFNEIINALAQMYMSGQRQMHQGLAKIEKHLGEIIEAEGLPPGVSDKKSMLRGVNYAMIHAGTYRDDKKAITHAVRDADLSVLIKLVEEVTGGSVNNTTSLILPKKEVVDSKEVSDG